VRISRDVYCAISRRVFEIERDLASCQPHAADCLLALGTLIIEIDYRVIREDTNALHVARSTILIALASPDRMRVPKIGELSVGHRSAVRGARLREIERGQ